MVRDTLEPPSQALSMRGEDLAVLGNGNAHGACSLLHAAGLGYGASIALDLPVAVRLLDSPSKRDLDDPDGLLDQVLAAWTTAGHELPEGKAAEAFHWAVASKIPPRQGLKSSAAIAVAALRALADATSTDLETAEIVAMAAQAQIDAGVSLTGSIDDAWACAANGWKLIDPQAESIQEGVLLESPGPQPEDWYVLLVCRGDRERKPELEDFVPQMYVLGSDGTYSTIPAYSEDCGEFSASQNSSVRGLTTIMTMKLLGEETEFEIDHITSRWAHVYSSGNTLLLAEPVADWWWFWRNNDFEDATNIHAFDISDSNSTSYLGSGRVSGTVQDQFSMSEFQGSIRIASTSDAWERWWLDGEVDENGEPIFTGPSNQVTILHHEGEDCLISPCNSLIQVGIVENIAPNETIWSARFIGDRGYLVTFENIDPLWVIDLSNPFEPIILGELEVPGVSTYIHPVNENTLLTIGIGPGEDGLGLDWSTTQISLFDVSDPTNPNLADSMPISPAYTDVNCADIRNCGWSWSWSEATYEHKAFTYWAPEDLLAIPLSTYRYIPNSDSPYQNYEYISLLKLINVDIENLSLSSHGDVDHSEFYNAEDDWWYHGSTSIRRSIFMGDYIYAFSSLGVTVHNISEMSLTDEILIPGQSTPSWYYEEQEVTEEQSDESNESSEEGHEGDEPCPDGPEGESCSE